MNRFESALIALTVLLLTALMVAFVILAMPADGLSCEISGCVR